MCPTEHATQSEPVGCVYLRSTVMWPSDTVHCVVELSGLLHVYVVPIPKLGKDTSDPPNYRPIALTSCVCKVMERMVNNRLVWYLERNKIITPTQSGFRKSRSTTDQLVRLESFVR